MGKRPRPRANRQVDTWFWRETVVGALLVACAMARLAARIVCREPLARGYSCQSLGLSVVCHCASLARAERLQAGDMDMPRHEEQKTLEDGAPGQFLKPGTDGIDELLSPLLARWHGWFLSV